MRIQRLEIESFRGIKSLDWKLPSEQRLVVLVGAGDSGKTTILDAIHYLLAERWNVPFSDTDFYGVDVTSPISIKAVLVDLPSEIRKENVFGLWLSGLDADGELQQDPEDDLTPALIVRLTVDASLEPQWRVERVDGQTQYLTSSQRAHFSTFNVDDRTDAQLRWSRTSALGRMSVKGGGEREALADASRAAREALAQNENSALAEIAGQVQEGINRIGGGRFSDLKPGLDTSRSSMGAALALYEDVIPLTSYGLGSRRLASLAVQQLAAGTRAVAVVDELETGLEPHRAVRLLNYLTTDTNYSQVVVTTHSPVVVEQARIDNLAVVRNDAGVVTVASLSGVPERLQKLRRARPSSFLARRVVVAEGATEHGLLLERIAAWDEQRAQIGLSTSAGEGVVVHEGGGGAEVPLGAMAMHSLGFPVAGFMDNDTTDSEKHVRAAEKLGIQIVRWDKGFNTETQVCSVLQAQGLAAFLTLAVDRRTNEATVLHDLNAADPGNPVSNLDVQEWVSSGLLTLENARIRIAKAAVDSKWFKEVEGGRVLGRWLNKNAEKPSLKPVVNRVAALHPFIYPEAPAVQEQSEVDGATDG